MFVTFFHELKSAGVPVTLREYLTLMEAMQVDLAGRRVEDFYYLARSALVKDERVVKAYQGIVDKVNGGLSQYETMKRFKVVPEEWSVEEGTLTPSMKLKRRVVEKKYEKEIREFYADEATAGKG